MRVLPKDPDTEGHLVVNMNKFRDPAVYALHAGDGVVRYVGSTSKNAQNRLWEHIYRARSGHTAPLYCWMREAGLDAVQVTVIARIDDSRLREVLEAATIAHYISEGCDLLNQMSRDGRPGSMSEAVRSRISAANAGKVTWIKGLRGEDAGWTPERRAEQSRRMSDRYA